MSTSTRPYIPRGFDTTRKENLEEKKRRKERRVLECFDPFLENRYRVEKIIGEGAYGVVAKATDVRTGEKVAVKRVRAVLERPAVTNRALREAKFLRLLSAHENIATVKDVFFSGDREHFKDIYIVLELMPVDLGRLLRSRSVLHAHHIKFFMFQIFRGVHCMHASRVFHRDLNPRNILVNNDSQIRICDFGLARAAFQSDDNLDFWTDYIVTRWYRAPELILACSAKYSTAIDMWSVGCIFAEMLSRGRPLFCGRNAAEQFQHIVRVTGRPTNDVINRVAGSPQARKILMELPPVQRMPLSDLFPHADPDTISLLQRLFEFEPERRISAMEALASPYFAEYRPIDLGVNVGPLPENEFSFEKGRLNKMQWRYEFLKEISLYHPDQREELLSPLRGDGHANAPERFGSAMSNVNRDVPMKDQSLPQAYFVRYQAMPSANLNFKSVTIGDQDMRDLEDKQM